MSTQILSDACPRWCRESWVGSLCWHVFVPCLAMYASNVWISVAVLIIIFQFPLCRVRSVDQSPWIFISHECRLRHQQQAYTLHINAESLQPHLPWRRTRDVPDPQCMCLDVFYLRQLLSPPHSGSTLPPSPGLLLLVDFFAGLWPRFRNEKRLTQFRRDILLIVPLLRKSSGVLEKLRRRKGSAWLRCHWLGSWANLVS